MNQKAIALIQQGLAMLTSEGSEPEPAVEIPEETPEEKAPVPGRKGRADAYKRQRAMVRKEMDGEDE